MNFDRMFKIVKELDFDKKKVVCEENNSEVYIFRPSKLSKRFEGYDVEKNFQIWLREDSREFRPNHLRVMIDLNLRTRSRPELKKELLTIFDNIFYGKDPDIEIQRIKDEQFVHFLNPLKVIACLHQLFIIEQEYCYHRESKFSPPTLFYQGWIREFIDSPKEIDNLCMSVANRQPSIAKYTDKENKKSKKYDPKISKLWYLN